MFRGTASPVYGMRQPPFAKDPVCARITAHRPDRLDGDRRDRVSHEGPAAPTKDSCISVNGVDWVLRRVAARDGRSLLVTYGRRPAVEATLAASVRQTDAVLMELSRLVAPVRQSDRCLGGDRVRLSSSRRAADG